MTFGATQLTKTGTTFIRYNTALQWHRPSLLPAVSFLPRSQNSLTAAGIKLSTTAWLGVAAHVHSENKPLRSTDIWYYMKGNSNKQTNIVLFERNLVKIMRTLSCRRSIKQSLVDQSWSINRTLATINEWNQSANSVYSFSKGWIPVGLVMPCKECMPCYWDDLQHFWIIALKAHYIISFQLVESVTAPTNSTIVSTESTLLHSDMGLNIIAFDAPLSRPTTAYQRNACVLESGLI